jgi:hypothetical protein
MLPTRISWLSNRVVVLAVRKTQTRRNMFSGPVLPPATKRGLEKLVRLVAKGLGNKEITSALLESASGMRGVASRLGFGRCLRGFRSIVIQRSSLRSGELSFCSADDVAAHQSLWHRDDGVAVTIPC